jgi:hypothetical protein
MAVLMNITDTNSTHRHSYFPAAFAWESNIRHPRAVAASFGAAPLLMRKYSRPDPIPHKELSL